MTDSNDNIQRPYKCTIHIALPSNQYAQHLNDVISVDQEISNKVVKSFAIVSASDIDGRLSKDDRMDIESGDCNGSDDMNVLQIIFEATDAKMLRVSISTTYDMINVALKCFQEFGD